MADVARLVGMELREYEKDGQQKQFCGLHLVYVEGASDEVIGSRVEVTSCPRGIDPNTLEVGQLYELGYDHFRMKGQLCARLKTLERVEG